MRLHPAVNLPLGLSINPATGLISGTIAAGAAAGGPYATVVTASDGTFSNSTAFAWAVTAPATSGPLTLLAPNAQSSTEGQSVSLQVQASSSDSGDIAYSAVGLPTGLTVNAETGLITGTIAAGAAANGPYLVAVTATEGTTSVTQAFVWQVSSPITIAPLNKQSSTEGQAISLQVSAADSSGGTPSYTASGLPTGLSINAETGLISGTIAAGASANGPFLATVSVTDGTYSNTQSFLWRVSSPVTLSAPAGQAVTEGQSISLQVSATDSSGGTPAYSAANLPPGLSINAETGLISGTLPVGAAQGGPYFSIITAGDGTYSASTLVVWQVAAAASAANPITLSNPGSQNSLAGSAVSLQVQASDSSGAPLTFGADYLPQGLSINPSTGLISGTITSGPDTPGLYTVVLTASDGTYSASQQVQWLVANPVTVNTVANQSGTEGQAVSLQVQANDLSGGALEYGASGLPTGLTVNAETGLITGTIAAGAAAAGPFLATVTASDASGNSASTVFVWQVASAINLTNPGVQSSTEGTAASLQVQATDSSGGTPNYSAVGLPTGLTVNSSTGLISGTITLGAAANGPYLATVTASDGTYSNSTTFLWQVGDAVTVTAPADQSSTEGQAVSLQVQAADASGASLQYTAVGLPAGLSINSSTGLISGTIAAGASANGPYLPIITASDGVSSASTVFNWAVANPIVITNPGVQSNVEGNAVSLQVQATDSAGGDLDYSASDLPTGLSISSSGLISGTIAAGASANGPLTTTVTVSDGTFSASTSFLWQLSSPVSVTAPGPQFVGAGSPASLQMQATDSTGGTPTWSATNLPSGLSINATTGLISGTLAAGSATGSPYTTTVTASDGTYSGTTTIVWQVAAPVTAGALTLYNPGLQSSTEDTAASLQIQASDSSGVAPSYAAWGLPAGLSINAQTGLISGTIAAGASLNGPYAVTVVVGDGTYSVSTSFLWQVNYAIMLTDPGDQSGTEGQAVSVQMQATDAGGGTPTYSASGLPTGLSINSQTGLISGTIAAGASANGPFLTAVTASDGSANPAAVILFQWQVASPISITTPSAQSNTEGDVVSLQVVATDSSGGTPEYSASGLPTGLSIDSSTGLISGTIAAGASANGPYAPTVTVSDGTYSASTSIPWSVANPITITDPGEQSASEGSAVSVQVQASDSISGADLNYSAVGLPTGLTINATTGLISGTPTIGSAVAGPYQTTVTVSDGTYSNSTSFAWQVTALASPPSNPISLTNPGTQSGTEGQSVSVQVQASDSSDADLQYSASGLPTGLSINATTGLISGTIAAGASANGPYAATVTVQDGTFSAAVSFLWQVSSPVSVTNPGNQSGSEGQSVSLQVQAADSSGGTPTFSAVNLPTGLTMSSSGLISGTIAGGASVNGPFAVTLTATDGTYSGSTSFLWQAANAITLITPADQSGTEGQSVSLQVQASDSTSGAALNYSATGLPTGLSINATTGVIGGTIAAGAAANGPYSPVVTVTDGSSTASTTINWAVANAISLTTPADQTNTEGQSVSLQIQASDSSGGTPTYGATGLPPGLTLNSATGLISGTLTLGPVNAGVYVVTLTAGDGTYSASTVFNWTVSSPITLTNPGTQSGTEGNAVSLQVQGNDPSGASLVFSATGLPAGLTISSSGLISGTIAAGAAANGPCTTTVTAGDGTTTASTTFLWQVSSPITIASPGTQYVGEGSAASLQMQATDSSGGTPAWSAASLPPGLSINSATGLISGTIASGAAANGPYVTTVTAGDGTYSNSVQVVWQVAAPAVSGSLTLFNPGTQANTEGQSVSLQVQASDSTNGADLDYGAVGLPSGLSINASTGLITGTITPGGASLGPRPTLVSVSDGANTVTTAFVWQIASAVTLTNPGNQSGSEGQAVSLQLQASTSSGGTPTFSAVGLPPGLGIDSATGLISGNIANGSSAYGPYQVVVTAEQGASNSSVSFAWQVSSPVALTNPGSQSSAEGQAVSLQLQASAPSGVAVNYSAIGLPPGLAINATTGLISGTPATGDGGPTPYLVLVTAQAGGSRASQVFSWQVSSPVSITTPGVQSSTEGQAVSLQVQATDSTSGAVVQYLATGLPLGLSINSATGLISGTVLPGAAAAGPYLVTVSASDGASSASDSFWWVVSSPLTLSNLGTQVSLTGTTVSLALLGGNANGGGMAFSAADLPPGLSINTSTGVISGTLASADQGFYDVTVTASSGAYSTSSTFEWLAVNTQASTCGSSTSTGLSQAETNALFRQLMGENVGGQSDIASQLQELGGVFADPDVQGMVQRALGRRSNDGMGKNIDGNAIDPDFGKAFPGVFLAGDPGNPQPVPLAAKGPQDGAPLSLAQPKPQTVVVGIPFKMQLEATGPAGMEFTVGGGAAGLPPGLTLDPKTGVISGTITKETLARDPQLADLLTGGWEVLVRVTVPGGATKAVTFTLTVEESAGGNAPVPPAKEAPTGPAARPKYSPAGANDPLWVGHLPTPEQFQAQQQELRDQLAKIDPNSARGQFLQGELGRLERLEPYVQNQANLEAQKEALVKKEVEVNQKRQKLDAELEEVKKQPQYRVVVNARTERLVLTEAGLKAQELRERIQRLDASIAGLSKQVEQLAGQIRQNEFDAAHPQVVQQRLDPAWVLRRDGSGGPVARTQDPAVRDLERGQGGRGQMAFEKAPGGKEGELRPLPNLTRPTLPELDRVVLQQYLDSKADAESRETALDILQGVLDLASLVPVYGWPLAIANGGISAARGRPTDAALRFLAVVPLLGGAKKIAQVAQRAEQAVAASRTEVVAGSALAKLKGLTDAGKLTEDIALLERQTAQALKSGTLKPAELEAVLQEGGWSAAAAKQKVQELTALGEKLAKEEAAALKAAKAGDGSGALDFVHTRPLPGTANALQGLGKPRSCAK